MSRPPGGADPAPERPLLPTATGSETRGALRGLLRPHRWLALFTAVSLVGATLAGLAVPPLLGRIVDVVAGGLPPPDVDGPALLLLLAALANGMLMGLGKLLSSRLGELVLAGLRERALSRALTVALEDLERYGTGDLVARVGGDVDVLTEATREAIPELVVAGLTVGLTVVGLAALDWRLALAGLAAAPIQARAARRYLRRSTPVYAAARVAQGARAHQLHASVAGASTVRAFRLHEPHVRLVEQRSQDAVDLALRTGRIRAWFYSGLNAAELTGLGTILVTGFLLVRSGAVTVGEAAAAAFYFHRLFDPIGTLLFLLDTAQSAASALARLVGVTSIEPPREPELPGEPSDASVCLERVHFAYPGGHEVLHDIDLRLAPGERLAIVGTSGAGKTTIAKLVAGIHRPTSGRLSLGGITLDRLGPSRLREVVALVTQEVHVFAGPLREDLRLARPGAVDEDLVAALTLVGALEWVEALPEGLDTVVGNGGRRLSATQAQQLALARLVLADPLIAVLDEATAEAGSSGARRLETAASAALEGRTALVIAHRLTQAAVADKVVVLESGRVVERGRHRELATGGGPYAQLWAAWSSAR